MRAALRPVAPVRAARAEREQSHENCDEGDSPNPDSAKRQTPPVHACPTAEHCFRFRIAPLASRLPG